MSLQLMCVSLHDENRHKERFSYEKSLKSACDAGDIKLVPANYVLPAPERPNISNDEIIAKNDAVKVNYNLKLPIMDFEQLQGPHRARVIESLQNACENFGFFQLVNHGISEDVISNMRDATRRFFDLPVTEREKYMSADVMAPVRYGTSFNQTKDVVFCWRDFLKLVCDPHVLSQWPSSPLDFRKHVLAYAEEMKLLYMKVVEAILESLGLGDDEEKKHKDLTMNELKNGSQFIVVNYYPRCPDPDLTLGIPPHSDIDFLTLLLQDQVNGLQIHHRGDWVGVDAIPGAFLVNVGDLLEILSNGKYKSVMHRALVNSMEPRFSVASFHSVPFEATVRPLPKLVNESNPRKYKDTDFATFLEYYKSCDSTNKNFVESRKICLFEGKQERQGHKAQ